MRMLALCLILALTVAMPALAAGYEAVEVKDGGTVAGTVKFVGTPPKLPPIAVKKNQDLCGNSVPSEALTLGADRGVRYTVVWIEGIAKGKKIDGKDVVLDNNQCRFVSHVQAVTASAPAKIRNSDPVLHNTHGFVEKKTVFNLALPNKDQIIDITRRLKEPGVVDVKCDAHSHMHGWIVVRPDPYVAVTDENGAFQIRDVPPGTYKVVAWHESWEAKGTDKDGRPLYGEPVVLTKEVTILPKGEAKVVFDLK